MREKLEYDMYIVDRAVEAMKEKGVEPIIQPIRGGTDGARLSFMGLLCPNLSTGGLTSMESMNISVYSRWISKTVKL